MPEEAPITIPWRWIDTFTSLVELHALAADSPIAVVSDEATDPGLTRAALLACARADAAPVGFRLPSASGDGDRLDHASTRAGLHAAALVLDLADVIDGSAHRDSVVSAARVVALSPGGPDVGDVVVHGGLGRRADRLAELLGATDAMAVTSPTGALLRISLDDERRIERGFARAVGELARWPGGGVWNGVDPAATSGSFVVMPGDLVLEARHIVASPVRFEVARGRLVEVLGDGPDADLVRSLLERRAGEDPDALRLREVGLGLGLARAGETRSAAHALGAGATRGGACTLVFGGVATAASLTLVGATVEIGDRPVVELGALTGAVAPDVYELAAAE